MSDIKNRIPKAGLLLLLKEKYGCKDLGKCIPPPYCSAENEPLQYITPTGFKFSFPEPNNGVDYSQELVDAIIKVAKLDVVVLHPATAKAAAEAKKED